MHHGHRSHISTGESLILSDLIFSFPCLLIAKSTYNVIGTGCCGQAKSEKRQTEQNTVTWFDNLSMEISLEYQCMSISIYVSWHYVLVRGTSSQLLLIGLEEQCISFLWWPGWPEVKPFICIPFVKIRILHNFTCYCVNRTLAENYKSDKVILNHIHQCFQYNTIWIVF